ncbi:MAG: hemerythrin family protein [Proteobacteria bacterium]|nr:hemerythrin family protein [Pseudomonadota bacterium]
MPLIEWDDSKLSVGIELIDTQHKKWVDIMNELDEAILSMKGQKVLEKIFAEMVDYVHYHFAEEEKLMEEGAYASLDEHKRMHSIFREHIKKYQKGFQSGDLVLCSQVMSTLKSWLQGHIMVEDRKFAAN